MQNVEFKVDEKKGTLTITIPDLSKRFGLSGSGNTVNIAGTQGNAKIGLGDITLSLSLYTKEGLAAERLKAAKEAGHKTWEDMVAAKKGA